AKAIKQFINVINYFLAIKVREMSAAGNPGDLPGRLNRPVTAPRLNGDVSYLRLKTNIAKARLRIATPIRNSLGNILGFCTGGLACWAHRPIGPENWHASAASKIAKADATHAAHACGRPLRRGWLQQGALRRRIKDRAAGLR